MQKMFVIIVIALFAAIGAPTLSAQDSPWQIRVRALAISPTESSDVSIGGFAEVDAAYVPEVDISYFFTDNWALELIAATAPHAARVRDSAIGDVDLGEVWLLPPTLTLQYHLLGRDAPFSPYVGAGINYTLFYASDEPEGLSIDYDDSLNAAFQAGFDYAIDDNWFFNVDVKYVLIDTGLNINNGLATADVDINPLLFGVGFGYRF